MIVGELSEVVTLLHERVWGDRRSKFTLARGGPLEQVLYRLGRLRVQAQRQASQSEPAEEAEMAVPPERTVTP
eukprot:6676483-Alexandrium_andersonii.AAC.1